MKEWISLNLDSKLFKIFIKNVKLHYFTCLSKTVSLRNTNLCVNIKTNKLPGYTKKSPSDNLPPHLIILKVKARNSIKIIKIFKIE